MRKKHAGPCDKNVSEINSAFENKKCNCDKVNYNKLRYLFNPNRVGLLDVA